MTVEILPVHRADLPSIARFLEKEWTHQPEPADVATLRERNWLPGEPNFGLRLMVDGEVAGFLGASYSARPIDGVDERFCAIAPWFVKREHRNHALPMLLKLLANGDMHYVNLTATHPTYDLFIRLGFARLDETKLLFPPLLNLDFFRPWRGRMVSGEAAVRPLLEGRELRIFEDHLRTRCRHLAVVDGNRVCYLVAGRRRLRNLAFAELLHVSDSAMIAPQFERVVWSLVRQFRAVGVAADERLVADAGLRAIRYKLNSPPIFRSRRIAREKIDNLWSELAF